MKKRIICVFSSVLFCVSLAGQKSFKSGCALPNNPAFIDIIVPAYNEQDRIETMLSSYCDFFAKNNVRFIVVLNGITDNTRAIVEKCVQKYPGRITIAESEKGKGNAIRHGFEIACKRNGAYIGFTDADGATPPDQMAKIINTLHAQPAECGVVIGSRHAKDSQTNRAFSFFKDIGRKFFFNRKVKNKLGLDCTDYQCGAKVFKVSVIQKIVPHITELGWAIDLDLLYLNKHAGYTMHEIGIVWNDQPGSHLELFSSGKDVCGAINRLGKKKLTIS